jgi:hypothetical protein
MAPQGRPLQAEPRRWGFFAVFARRERHAPLPLWPGEGGDYFDTDGWPHWPDVPPPPHVSGDVQVPHWISLPQPSPAGPQEIP